MDHLPQPIEGRRVAVPFAAERRIYRPGDFFDVPKTFGFDNFDDLLEYGYECRTGMNKARAEQFLQSWLWFALLSRVLGIDIDSVDFEAHGNFLDSNRLNDLLEQWETTGNELRKAQPRPSADQKFRYTRGSMALAYARRFVSKHCMCERMDRPESEDVASNTSTSTLVVRRGSTIHRGNVPPICVGNKPDPKLMMSLAILGETLQQARPQMFSHLEERTEFWCDAKTEEQEWGYSHYSRNRLLQRGWCPLHVYRLESSLASVSAMYYASEMKPWERSRDHSMCTWSTCIAPKASKEVLHVDHCSSCRKHGVPGGDAALISIIEQGKTPLVSWSRRGLQVKGYDLEKDPPVFGTISHAWEDRILASGGGEAAEANDRQAHECQIKRLQERFNELLHTTTQYTDWEPVPFWVDILCIPRDASVIATAIDQTKDIYRKAGVVMVWDRGLLGSYKSDEKDTIEMNMRIKTSNWSQRLWTFSETVRADNLHVAFKNGVVSVKDLEGARDLALQHLRHPYHHIWKVGQPFSPSISALRMTQPERKSNMRPKATGPAEEQGLRVQRAWHAVQFRSVTEATDETLVLAHVLEIDVKDILSISPSDPDCVVKRMVVFLDLLDATPGLGIPSGIIFLPGPYLRHPDVAETKGYGWAPRSWLTRQANAYPLLRPLRQTAVMHKRGLLVQFPGLVLHCPTTPIKQCIFWVPLHQVMHKWFKVRMQWSENKTEADVVEFWKTKIRPDGKTSIIMSTGEPRDRWESGLLVQKKQRGKLTQGTVRWVERLCIVWVRLETNPNVVSKLMTEVRERGDEMILGERLDESTQWCIDGDE